MEKEKQAKIKHLKFKFSIARYELIKECEAEELRFYLYLKLYAINNSSAFPSQETIERDLGWSADKRRYWVKRMSEKGRLKYTAGSGRLSSLYDITWYDKLNESGRGGKNPVSGKIQPQGLSRLNLRGGVDSTRTSTNITSTNITSTPLIKNQSSRNSIKFPKKNYNFILEEYQKLKGIKLQGEEFKPYQQIIKTMFMSNRSVKNILNCMKWLEKSEDKWTTNWTLKTVKMKLPEFLAGKFENKVNLKQIDLTKSSSNPLFREWIVSRSKLDFKEWVEKVY